MERILYHGAQAYKLLYNIRGNSVTADSSGRIFFAANLWQECLMHGADTSTGESYVGRFRVEIPVHAKAEPRPTRGNSDAVIIHVAPHGSIPAQFTDLIIRRGSVAEGFHIVRMSGHEARAYLESKVANR